jgi:hypothetical protein
MLVCLICVVQALQFLVWRASPPGNSGGSGDLIFLTIDTSEKCVDL